MTGMDLRFRTRDLFVADHFAQLVGQEPRPDHFPVAGQVNRIEVGKSFL